MVAAIQRAASDRTGVTAGPGHLGPGIGRGFRFGIIRVVSLEELSAAIGPPRTTPFPVDWAGVEARLGLRLPADYRAFAEAYGPALVGDWLWVLVPHDSDRGGYFHELAQWQGLHRTLRDQAAQAHPYAFHPEPGGLLLWGTTRGTDNLFWDTGAAADPDDWPTRAYGKADGHPETWRSMPMPATSVIAGLIRGELALHPEASPARWSASWQPLAWSFSPLRLDGGFPEQPAADPLPAAGRAFAATLHAAPVAEQAPAGSMPGDYAALIGQVGPGLLGGGLRLLTPGPDMDAEHARHADRLRTRRAAGLPVVPAPLAPEPAGLRLWGVFGTGETCWWQPATADASGWPLILLDAEGVGWQRLDVPTTQFLGDWLDGRLDLPVLSQPPARRDRTLTRADAPVTAPPTTAERDPLAQLETIIGPAPAGHGYDWAAVEADLPVTGVPTDYRRLMSVHGALTINGIRLIGPDELVEEQAEHAELLADSWGDDPDEALLFYPEPGGLLVCATTESRQILFWDTTDPDPDRWTIVWDVDIFRETFAGTLTELLLADLTGRLEPRLSSRTPSSAAPEVLRF